MQMGTHQVVVKKPGDTQASPCGQLSIILTDTQIGRNTIVLPAMPITVQEKLDTPTHLRRAHVTKCARASARRQVLFKQIAHQNPKRKGQKGVGVT